MILLLPNSRAAAVFTTAFFSVLSFILCAGSVGAADTPAATPKSTSAIVNTDFSLPLAGNWRIGGAAGPVGKIVDAAPAGLPPGVVKALQVTTNAEPDSKPWDAQVRQANTLPIKKGDMLAVRVYLRSPDKLHCGVFVEQTADPFTKTISQNTILSPDWREYRFFGVAPRDFAPGGLQLNFQVAYGRGTIEIADARLVDFGSVSPEGAAAAIGGVTVDYWAGQAHPDTWRAAALARIERYRKADFSVHVVDAAGKPVKGAKVSVEMTRQAFHWGNIVSSPSTVLNSADPNNVRMQQVLKTEYNTATFEGAMKWKELANTGPEGPLKAINWLHANGLDVRGHNLVWGSWQYLPPGLDKMPIDELREGIRRHIIETVTAFKGKVYIWDVVNEASTQTQLWDKVGWESFADAYKWAREADPDVLLCYNDYNISNESAAGDHQRKVVEQKIQYLLGRGAPLDVIADQAHIGLPLTPIGRVIELWNEFSRFGKPVEITEFDAAIPDDKLHGQYVRDFITAAYSEPFIEGFIQWGFWEGRHWKGDQGAALYRRDWSKRPAEKAYEDLVLHQWWTRAKGSTGGDGSYRTRGFLGNYRVTVTAPDGIATVVPNVTLARGGRLLMVTLKRKNSLEIIQR